MIDVLRRAFREKVLVSLCIDRINWDRQIIGYLIRLTKEYIILDEVDEYGAFSKRTRLSVNRVSSVRVADSYNVHLELLKMVGSKIKKVKNRYLYNDGDLFFFQLTSLIESEVVCTFFFDTQYIFGIASKVDHEMLSIKTVGYRGTLEGEMCCRIGALTKIRYEGAEEEKIGYLLKLH